jgi:NADH-quinone oxidoreductase subunit H
VDRAWFLGPAYLFIKIVVLLGIMIWVRASWPRIRYDRLMSLGWKILIPLSLAVVFITAVGILLENYWMIALLSILAGLVAVMAINRDLRRKAYERA